MTVVQNGNAVHRDACNYYVFFSGIEIAKTTFIIWYAWRPAKYLLDVARLSNSDMPLPQRSGTRDWVLPRQWRTEGVMLVYDGGTRSLARTRPAPPSGIRRIYAAPRQDPYSHDGGDR